MRVSVAHRAYIAGFIEGEGTFVISSGKWRGKSPEGRYRRHLGVTVAQKNRKPLEFIQRLYGGGIRSQRRRNGRIYLLYLRRAVDVMQLIEDIYPFLIASRARYRAACVYKFAELTGKSGCNLSLEVRDKREKIYEMWSRTRR